jgi:hypothetical protein
VLGDPGPNAEALVAELERVAEPLPLSLRAFYTMVGSVNFVGAAPRDWNLDERADPLYVYPVETALAEYADWADASRHWQTCDRRSNPGPFRVPIAPDYLHKYNISGGMWYHIVLPNRAIDGPLRAEHHRTTLVDYLRIALQRGGFPGLYGTHTHSDDWLTYLTDGLLAI